MVDTFDFLNDSVPAPGAAANLPNVVEADPTGRFDFLKDPNIIQALGTAGRGFSAGREFGDVLGEAAQDITRKRALQQAVAKQSKSRGGLVSDIVKALREDPIGSDLLGDPNDPNTANRITLDNNGIKLDLPNPGKTSPFDNLRDIPVANQTSEAGRGIFSPESVEDVDMGEELDLRDFLQPS